MAMTAIAVRCRWHDGSVSDMELPAVVEPAQWTAHDARETAWAIQLSTGTQIGSHALSVQH
jgi:hypothetical protein